MAMITRTKYATKRATQYDTNGQPYWRTRSCVMLIAQSPGQWPTRRECNAADQRERNVSNMLRRQDRRQARSVAP